MHANEPSTEALNAAIQAARIFDNGWRVAAVPFNGRLFKLTEHKGTGFIQEVGTEKFVFITYGTDPSNNSVMSIARGLDSMLRESHVTYDMIVREILEMCPVNFMSTPEQCVDHAVAMSWIADVNDLDKGTFINFLAAVSYGVDSEEAWIYIDENEMGDDYIENLENLIDWKTRDHVSGG